MSTSAKRRVVFSDLDAHTGGDTTTHKHRHASRQTFFLTCIIACAFGNSHANLHARHSTPKRHVSFCPIPMTFQTSCQTHHTVPYNHARSHAGMRAHECVCRLTCTLRSSRFLQPDQDTIVLNLVWQHGLTCCSRCGYCGCSVDTARMWRRWLPRQLPRQLLLPFRRQARHHQPHFLDGPSTRSSSVGST